MLLTALAAWTMLPGFALGAPPDARRVPFDVYTSYFEKNDSGLDGDSSFVTFTDSQAFDRVFGAAAVMGRQRFLPPGAFSRKLVLATIKRGGSVWSYKVDRVSAHAGTLFVEYDAKPKDGGARFASPLIVAVPRGDYKAVVFVENGRTAATLAIR